jgi:hypothetical protein
MIPEAHLLFAGRRRGRFLAANLFGHRAKVEKLDLLLLEDFGLQPFDGFGRSTLMERVEETDEKLNESMMYI